MIEIFIAIMRDVLTHEIREELGGTYNVNVKYEFIGGCYQLSIGTVFDPNNLELVREIIFSKALKEITDKEIFERKKRDIINDYYISDFTMNKFCENAQDDLIRYGRIISIKEEIYALKNVLFEEYKLIFDYFSNTKRWWSLIEIP